MADKKPAAKPAPKSSSAEGQMIFLAVILVIILFVVVPTVLMFFGHSGKISIVPKDFISSVSNAFSTFVDTVGFISIFISLMLAMGLVYAKTRHKEIVEEYTARMKAVDNIGKGQGQFVPGSASGGSATGTTTSAGAAVVGGMVLPGTEQASGFQAGNSNGVGQSNSAPLQITNPKWIQIENLMQSHNVSEWKVAILEADILLYDMLTQMGYEGDSIGEILKNVDKANFVTIDDAWKAHRIRNIIAHEGANYELSREEAERTIRLFKRVFDEFYFV